MQSCTGTAESMQLNPGIILQGDTAEEEKITSTFKELFKSYDIMS